MNGNGKKNGGMNGYGNGKKNGNGGGMGAYGNGKRNGGMNGYGNGKKNGNGGSMNAFGNGKGMNGGGTGGIGIGKVNGNGGTKNGRDMLPQRPDVPQVDDTVPDDGDEGTTMQEPPAHGDEEQHGGPGDEEQIMQNMYGNGKPKNGNGRPSNGAKPTNGVHEDDGDDIQQMMQHMMNGGRRNGNGNGKKPGNGYQPRNGGGSGHGEGNGYGGDDHGGSSGGDHGDGHDGHHGGDPIQWLRDAIRGEPGQDYPIFAEVPSTAFKCSEHEWPGYYADVEARCQVFHICQMDGRADAFLCPNGTIFSQQHFVCVWWHDFDCSTAESLYQLNSNLFQTVSNQTPDGGDEDDRTGQVETFK
ncbi:hypothetical protein B4U80_00535 [Leptotrombidium deliense]|uniref:Chitin-binding type-2 domain-containing protein n=1 Tax=Leptotrombidium deliense TaxID=299467 RepID=A0A443SP27_9ACAR|nr:hypothetical protein B4U80_00535 [Leptotrombidium deliense]